ncbi:MAG: hypothetical protein LUE90_03685 [Clostridiales bacterium]|nr:hypothetical protein [Clostridiales bacterium]
MKFKADRTQREALSALLDKYENSKTYRGENQIQQTFAISPDIVMKEYASDFADVEQIHLFEEELETLEGKQLIRLERRGTVIRKIVLVPESIPVCYEILGRKDKNTQIREQIAFYESYRDSSPVLNRFCTEQIRLLEAGHKPEYAPAEAEKLLPLCLFILKNRQELLERELSIVWFGDSKLFEMKFRARVCRLLQKYSDCEELLDGIDDKREREQIILGEYGIVSNPSYLYMKGEATLVFRGLPPVELSQDIPVAYSSESIKRLERIDRDYEKKSVKVSITGLL